MSLKLARPLVCAKSFTWNETVWNPSMIQTALWLDAADASTVTTVSGAVSQWNDKSGNARHASQLTGSLQPTLTAASLNGKSGITFNSDSLAISNSAIIGQGNSNFSILVVYKPTFSTSYGTIFTNFLAGNFGLYVGTGIAYLTPWGIYNNANIDISSDVYVQNANNIISAVRSSGSFTGWTNGTENNTVANTASVYAGAATSSAWYIGSNSTAGEAFTGVIYEIVCVADALSPTNRQKTEGYLAHKWGLTANLPAGHPYKTVGPTP